MLTPKIMVTDTYSLVKVGLYKDAAKWLTFCLYNWLVHIPIIIFTVPIALIAMASDALIDFIQSSKLGDFFSSLDDIEDKWRDELREKYKARKVKDGA